jgi:Zn-dependent M28 family amino/carboxypeptidase
LKTQLNLTQTFIYFIIIILIGLTVSCGEGESAQPTEFDGGKALQDIQVQVDIGPRVHGSEPHAKIIDWISERLTDEDWTVELQKKNIQGHEINNIIGKREKNDNLPLVIIGTHYDTRMYADRDEKIENTMKPVPGANDGASGVAVLLELARVLPKDIDSNLWLVFFDAEDNGGFPGYEWILGSTAFVDSLDKNPDAVVVIDMIGDKDLNIPIEKNSDQRLSQEIWDIADTLGYSEQFIAFPKHRITDDHLPFVQAGIPAVLIIDIDYPFWHQTTDTVDKVSPQSLKTVGDVLLNWLIEGYSLEE